MHLQLLRNATLRLNYAGRKLLIDPCLGAKGSLPSFAGIAPNPTVDLPTSTAEIVEGAELAVISHLHADHFDAAGETILSKELPIFCQSVDRDAIVAKGFTAVTSLDEKASWNGLSLQRTDGQHGTGEILKRMGSVMGFLLKAEDEPTAYWAGDTILTADVLRVVANEKPDVIITHSGGATLGGTLLIMDDAQTIQLSQNAGAAVVVAVHMEALDHCTVSHAQLRVAARTAGISDTQLLIPTDGERIEL